MDWFLYDRDLHHKMDKSTEKSFGKLRYLKIMEINEKAIPRLLLKSEFKFLTGNRTYAHMIFLQVLATLMSEAALQGCSIEKVF